MNYLNRSTILDQYQTGFREFHSTQSALFKLTDDICVGKDRKLATLLLQFEFSKAFDTISPSKLLTKLRNLGFSGLVLSGFWSISVRIFTILNICILWYNLGVPQNRPLALSFSAFTSMVLRTALASPGHWLLLCRWLRNIHPGASYQIWYWNGCQAALWLCSNGYSVGGAQSPDIIFGTAHTIKFFKDLQTPKITINNTRDRTEFFNEIISLGVILENTLSCKAEVNRVTKRVNKALYGIPHLNYCSIVYHDASFTLRKSLQWLANEGIRYIFGLRRDAHITPYRRELGWLRSDSRRDYFALLILYRILRMRKLPMLIPFFATFRPDRSRGMRKDLEIGSAVSAASNVFQIRFAKMWNSIPSFIRNQPSYSGFKKGIKQYLTNLDI